MTREMKDSGVEWIGQIPKEWDIIPNKHVMSKMKNICFRFNGEKILSLSMKGVKERNFEEGGKVPSTFDGYQYIFPNNLLMCLFDYDVTPRCIGYIEDFGITSPAYSQFKLLKENCSKYYYYYYLMLDNDKIILHLAKNLRHSFTEEQLGLLKIPVPSPDTQIRIANFLDLKCSQIHSILTSLQDQIDTLESYKKSVITEAVTKGLNPNAEMKDSGIEWIGEMPKHWDVTFNKYVMEKKKNICSKYNGEDILSLTLKGVVVRDFESGGKMPASFDGYQIIEPGNLLMCLFDYDVTPRCIGIIKNYGLTSPAYSQFVMKNYNSAKYYFYYYLMIDNTKEILHLAKNLRHSFTEEQLGLIKTPVPPIKEQNEIANFLDTKCSQIDTIISQKKEQMETLKEYKKSLIYEYVTGKKEVPNEHNIK